MHAHLSVLHDFVTDTHGRLAIAQMPNLPAWLLIGSIILRAVVSDPWHLPLDISTIVFLTYWAWLELTEGISPFRRLLGLVGLLFAARHLLMLIASH